MGSRLVLDGEDLFIENPENIYPEIEEVIKSYKSNLIKYLQGQYMDKHYNIEQTIEKIINFYRGVEHPINDKIVEWLNEDQDAINNFLSLCLALSQNGWTLHEPIANYHDSFTWELSELVYQAAMKFFKGN